jgi:nicotinate-nucleotide adenylyltransferase
MGSDGLPMFPKWKNSAEIQKHYKRYVYPRPGYEYDISSQSNLELVNAPHIEISSSYIRQAIHEGKDVRHFMPPGAREYLDDMNFYRS